MCTLQTTHRSFLLRVEENERPEKKIKIKERGEINHTRDKDMVPV